MLPFLFLAAASRAPGKFNLVSEPLLVDFHALAFLIIRVRIDSWYAVRSGVPF